MQGYTVISLSADSSNQDVQIAGNFNNWQPKSMKYNDSVNRYEYTVEELVDGSKSGKYNFKFVINGVWQCDQNYASEQDASGNENNVIVYDYTDDKSASDEYVSSVKKQVSQDNEEEPTTPDPTPYALSAKSTNNQSGASSVNAGSTSAPAVVTSAPAVATTTATTAAAAAVGILPLTEDPKDNISSHSATIESTTASKTIPKTEALKGSDLPPTNGSSEFIPLTESKKDYPISTKTSSIPKPEPVKIPELPTKTEEPIEPKPFEKDSKPVESPAAPQPVSRPEVPKPTSAPKVGPTIPESSLPILTKSTSSTKDNTPLPGTFKREVPKVSVPQSKPDLTNPYSTTFGNNIGSEPANNQVFDNRGGKKSVSKGKELPEYSLGFFATILHVITQFFQRWFTGRE